MKAKLECTRNYDLFEMHELNRPLHDNPVLLASMKTHGFMPSSPIQCARGGGDTLRVIRGHHRLDYAKRLGLPVYYVVDDSNCDIFDLEAGTGQSWSVSDFALARAKAGDWHCQALIAFRDKHGLTLGAAASLMGGHSAASNNKIRDIKTGKFRVGDTTHAGQVVSITDLCRKLGMEFATSTAFVHAVSMALRVPEFDAATFRHRIEVHPSGIRRQARTEDYLDEIDTVYNYGAREKRIPLKYRAREIGRQRKETFGGSLYSTSQTGKP